ncbi:MAG: penicillin-binding protein 1C [Rubrivivax sp.]
MRAQPSFDEVKAAHRPSDLLLLDRHGEPLQTLRVDPSVRRGPWVPLQDFSPALLQALVLSEDRRFWQHSGVDWAAAARSAWGNLIDTRTRGASTLTMQLAGLIDEGLARPVGGRSVWQKLGQAWVARRLEQRWTKAQVLEAYLNTVPLRGELVGVNALAQTLFGKYPSGLDAQEAALTAALVRGPNAGAERVAQRACGVLKEMGQACLGIEILAAQALQRRPQPLLGEALAPHYARLALRRDGPAQQHSSIDVGLQRVARQALQRQLAELQGRQVEDGAVLVLDNASGEVLAWVGANGGSSAAAQVDGVLARRQAGSTLKPFVYGLAFERRLITPASLLDDGPAEVPTQAGLYLPQNYDKDFKGLVSARAALGNSLNVPAVRVAALLPPDALHARLNALGFGLKESGGWYGLSLALGSADVSLLALANAYRSLANGGVHAPPALPGQPRAVPRRVASAAATHLVTDILADNNARVLTFGLDSPLRTRGFAAVKTGTSKDMRDNWCVGFSDRYTVGVWIGNAGGQPMHEVSGISGAAPIWQAVMAHLHRGRASRAPAPPAGVEHRMVRYESGIEPPRGEWFVAGTTPVAALAARHAAQRPGIRSPSAGAIYALDPDMPAAVQRIRLEGEAGVWELDGRRLGQGPRLRWAPWPGRHELRLLAADGREIDRVRFEVRGATLKPPARP